MKLFEIDWSQFYRTLPLWRGLSVPAKEAFVACRGPSRAVKRSELGPAWDELTEVGLLRRHPLFDEARIHPAHLGFWRAIRTLSRVQVLNEPSFETFHSYLDRHFAGREQAALIEGAAASRPQLLFEKCTSMDWIEGFLNEDSSQFEERRLPPGMRRFFITPGALSSTQEMVRYLTERREPAPLQSLEGTFDRMQLSVILPAGLRYLYFYATLRASDMEPVLGVWPPISRRLRQAPPVAPVSVRVEEEFESAFLADDLTQVLIDCSNRALRLRSRGDRVFVEDEKRIASALIELPSWLEAKLGYQLIDRIREALLYGKQFGFIESRLDARQLAVTEEGRLWLAKPAGTRLRLVLDSLKQGGFRSASSRARGFMPWKIRISSPLPQPKPNLELHVREAFLRVVGDESYSAEAFARFQAVANNPLKKMAMAGGHLNVSISLGWKKYEKPGSEALESIWHNILMEFLCRRMIPLGGVRVGFDSDGAICFVLTEAGRYFLNASDSFDEGSYEDAEVLVQANFEVVFLARAPHAEAEIGRFAERVGRHVGVVFRITKRAVFAAVENGMRLGQILQPLERYALRDVPDNVRNEIGSWVSQCRTVQVRPSILIQCPDGETAERALAVSGGKVRILNETTLEILVPKEKRSILNRLRTSGIFLDFGCVESSDPA